MPWARPQMHHFLIFNYHTPTTEEGLGHVVSFGSPVWWILQMVPFLRVAKLLCEFQPGVVWMRMVTPWASKYLNTWLDLFGEPWVGGLALSWKLITGSDLWVLRLPLWLPYQMFAAMPSAMMDRIPLESQSKNKFFLPWAPLVRHFITTAEKNSNASPKYLFLLH